MDARRGAQSVRLQRGTVPLLLGTICDRKGQLDLVRALARLEPAVFARLRCYLVGDRPSPYSEQLHQEIDALPGGLCARIGGPRDHGDRAFYSRRTCSYARARESFPASCSRQWLTSFPLSPRRCTALPSRCARASMRCSIRRQMRRRWPRSCGPSWPRRVASAARLVRRPMLEPEDNWFEDMTASYAALFRGVSVQGRDNPMSGSVLQRLRAEARKHPWLREVYRAMRQAGLLGPSVPAPLPPVTTPWGLLSWIARTRAADRAHLRMVSTERRCHCALRLAGDGRREPVASLARTYRPDVAAAHPGNARAVRSGFIGDVVVEGNRSVPDRVTLRIERIDTDRRVHLFERAFSVEPGFPSPAPRPTAFDLADILQDPVTGERVVRYGQGFYVTASRPVRTVFGAPHFNPPGAPAVIRLSEAAARIPTVTRPGRSSSPWTA